jgi:hypothetical protein
LSQLRQGLGVTADSGKTVLRSGIGRELPESVGQGVRREACLLPKSFVIKMLAMEFHTGALTFIRSGSTLPEVTFAQRSAA